MDKKLAKNFIYNMINQILLVLSPVITMPLLSRALGAEGLGEYSYAYAITSYFVLFATLGCDIYGRREIAYSKQSLEDRSKKFWSIQIVKLLSTIIIIVIYLIFSFNNPNKTLLMILIFHLINVPLNIGWFFQGIEEFKKMTIRGVFFKIVELLFVVIFIHKPDDLILYVFGSSLLNFLSFFTLWFDIKKYIKIINIKQLSPKNVFKENFVFLFPAIATSIYTLIDKTMLGIITNNYVENGYYDQALKINIILLRIVLAFGVVLLPRIAQAYKKSNVLEIKSNIEKSSRYVFFTSFAIAFGLLSVSDLFVPWFFGNGFDKVSLLLKASGFIIIFQGLNDVFGMQYLVSINEEKKYIKSLFIGSGINFLFNILLIYYFKSFGAILASIIGECCIVLVQCIYIKKGLNLKKIFLNSKNYLFAGIVMSIILYFLANSMKATIFNTFTVVACGGIIYCGTLFILKDPIILETITTLKKNLHKKKSNI